MNDKKIIYKKTNREVEIGDEIIVDVKLTGDFINKNSNLFIIKDVIPDYFKCIKIIEDGSYTKGKIYKHKYKHMYPGFIGLVNDKGEEVYVYIGGKTTYFIPSDKGKFDKQELLAEAKRRYPIGTRFKSINGLSNIYIIEGDYLQWNPYFPHYITCGPKGVIIYTQNEDKWAEIITPKFTSEDGVEIYDKMKTWVVSKDLKLRNHSDYNGAVTNYKYFYHKENALAYIEKHKEKTLEDYENILLTDEKYFKEYHWLKDTEPKLYYTKILQFIADDLNDDWIREDWECCYHLVYFKTVQGVEKAVEILGENVKYLFK